MKLKLFIFGFLTILGFAARAQTPSSESEPINNGLETAVFAGGCFWCIEADFEKLDGVAEAVSGYAGGHKNYPTYKEVSRGGTGHLEVIEVRYHPDTVSYRDLVHYFFRHVDPTDAGGQFCDRGESYETAIFVKSESERNIAEAVKADAATALNTSIVTPIIDLNTFWEAEDYHQDYYKKNPLRYAYYRRSCGRDARVRSILEK